MEPEHRSDDGGDAAAAGAGRGSPHCAGLQTQGAEGGLVAVDRTLHTIRHHLTHSFF